MRGDVESTINRLDDKSLAKVDDPVERARHYESRYRQLYTALLRSKKESIQQAWENDREKGEDYREFAEESRLLREVVTLEGTAMLFGLAAGAAVFGTFRVLTGLARRLSDKGRVEAARLAQEEARKDGSVIYQRMFVYTIEGGIAAWTASRGYHYQSKKSDGAFQKVARIPLCSGRSAVSESLCNDWLDITKNQIPAAFWENLQHDNALRDEKAWQAILKFSENCRRRSAYAYRMKSEQGLPTDDNSPIILESVVPDDIALSKAEVANLIDYRPS